MFKVCILILAAIVACSTESTILEPRVEGGVPVEIENFSYTASVQAPGARGRTHISTGTILSNRWILTTASRLQYFTSPRAFQIRTGSTHSDYAVGTDYSVEELVQHPSYDPSTNAYDLALLKVDHDIEFNDKTTSIGLVSEDSVGDNVSGNLIGWGNTYVDSLQVSRLYSVDLKTVALADRLNLHVSTIGADVCYSDVGGPFVVDDKVVGISTLNRIGCGLTDQYVTGFDANTLDWINSVIG